MSPDIKPIKKRGDKSDKWTTITLARSLAFVTQSRSALDIRIDITSSPASIPLTALGSKIAHESSAPPGPPVPASRFVVHLHIILSLK